MTRPAVYCKSWHHADVNVDEDDIISDDDIDEAVDRDSARAKYTLHSTLLGGDQLSTSMAHPTESILQMMFNH